MIDCSQKMNADVSKVAQEKLMTKMEEALKKREEQLRIFVHKMKSHVRPVRRSCLNIIRDLSKSECGMPACV